MNTENQYLLNQIQYHNMCLCINLLYCVLNNEVRLITWVYGIAVLDFLYILPKI